ncbi:MAG TPA: peptide chain release factor N(5)-glutamine methyltransferase [Bacillales bacterium]|nr:peptide chain release factor N(5)-glutamine methyltransferase [Bacillales bacterium]
MRVHEALKRASSFLQAHGREPQAAELLFRHHLGVTRTKFFQMLQDDLPGDVEERLMADIRRHANGVPVQHLTEEEMFYGRRFHVNRDVLIPRPETEELVEAVLKSIEEQFPEKEGLRVVDVGTGSGVIAATLALEAPDLAVSAVDLSEAALSMASQNAARLGAQVDFYRGDLLSPLIEQGLKADVVVSNPPYIPDGELKNLDPIVKDHDPRLALDGGDDGLAVYRKLTAQLPKILNRRGLVAFEIGVGQSKEVADLLRNAFGDSTKIFIKKDINGKERMVIAMISR